MEKTVNLEIVDHIAIVSFARPEKMNSFDHQVAVDLLRIFEKIQKNRDVRAVLLRGEGRVFCVGGDIKMFADKLDEMPSNIPDTMEVLNSLIMLMRNLSKPILVSAHGAVAGIGMSFLMVADLAIAAESTQFTLAYANIGLTPDGLSLIHI